jgi:hypothetical protein
MVNSLNGGKRLRARRAVRRDRTVAVLMIIVLLVLDRSVAADLGVVKRASTARAREVLAFIPRSVATAVEDGARSLVARGLAGRR